MNDTQKKALSALTASAKAFGSERSEGSYDRLINDLLACFLTGATVFITIDGELDSGEFTPGFVELSDGREYIAVYTTRSEIEKAGTPHFTDLSVYRLFQIMAEWKDIGGMVINPFTEPVCFVRQRDVLMLKENFSYIIEQPDGSGYRS